MRKTLFAASLAVGLGLVAAPTASADIIHADDVIAQFSMCIGNDCVNGESFGFDTLRLKENNLRINFADTSNSASFPTNDWRIVINDTSNGGANYFAVEDSDAGRQPFRIEAGAPANSLYVEDGGRVGFGTSTPVVDLHVVSGNTPTLRLQQDGSSGFTAQTWDLAGNEANFFVRDATNGSTLPFRIKPGAPNDALTIAADGDVGIGTNSPNFTFHVRDSGTVITDVESSNNGAVQHRLISAGGAGSRRIVGSSASATPQSQVIFDDNQVRIAGTNDVGNLFATFNSTGLTLAGVCSDSNGGIGGAADGCDAVFEPAYELPSIEDHAAYMWENKHLPAIGPTPEGKVISLSVQQRHFGVLNELEKAHIYIEQLNEKMKEKSSQVDELTERLARLEAALLK